MSDRPLRAIGITCGIGSMLVGARQAGFEIVGNVEWRKYYHHKDPEGRNTFTANFPGAIFKQRYEDLTDEERTNMTLVDLALGHPECGNFSAMTATAQQSRTLTEINKDPGDIPLFVDLVSRFRPRFFVMDDLPKSFIAYPMENYAQALPDYDLYPEWISNWGYGNVQRFRNRFFMIGALKEERWAFVPGEVEHDRTVRDVLAGLPIEPTPGAIPNHDPHALKGRSGCPRPIDEFDATGQKYYDWDELARWFAEKPDGYTYEYVRRDGELKKKVGLRKAYWEKECPVLHGGRPIIHPIRNMPFTLRERARIQGFPDDFVFYGTTLNPDGTWDHEKMNRMVKQTGKAMPIQFCQYVSQQIRAHIVGERFEASGQRVIKPNPYVDAAKQWYCENVGYADQDRACASCWLYNACTTRMRVYGIGEPKVGQPGVIPIDPPRLPPKTRELVAAPKLKTSREIRDMSNEKTPPAPKTPSPLRGKRPGVGRRMRELIVEGRTTEEILAVVRREFPESRAGATDVAKVRARVASGDAPRPRRPRRRKPATPATPATPKTGVVPRILSFFKRGG